MNIRDFIELCKSVLKHWEVIVTVVAMILILKFTNFVIKYRKKPKKNKKKKKGSVPAPKPKPAAAPSEGEEEDEKGKINVPPGNDAVQATSK